MSDLLPLFPLPSVVLFPGVSLPLHIFEPRYREMVAHALTADHLIGMVLLREGWQTDYEGRPPVFEVGCTGVVTHWEMLDDGRYNVILHGVERFRILDENHERSYRRALIDPLPERALGMNGRDALRTERTRIEALLTPAGDGSHLDPRTAAAMNDHDLVNTLSQYLDLAPLEKQALLEQPSIVERGQALVELLEMRAMAGDHARRVSPRTSIVH